MCHLMQCSATRSVASASSCVALEADPFSGLQMSRFVWVQEARRQRLPSSLAMAYSAWVRPLLVSADLVGRYLILLCGEVGLPWVVLAVQQVAGGTLVQVIAA